METSQGGKTPVQLESGEERRFLEDGDEVILRARARHGDFVPIGFGECSGVVLPALARTIAGGEAVQNEGTRAAAH